MARVLHMGVNEEGGTVPAVDGCGMNLYQPLLNDLLADHDGLSHCILFAYPVSGYDVPCEIRIGSDRRQIVIAASTARRLPRQRIAAASRIAALSCPHDLPFVVVDEPTRRVVAVFPVPAGTVACGPLVDLLLLSTVRRLVTVARRIDLHAGGLSVESVAAIDDTTLVHATGAFRRYRPFTKTL